MCKCSSVHLSLPRTLVVSLLYPVVVDLCDSRSEWIKWMNELWVTVVIASIWHMLRFAAMQLLKLSWRERSRQVARSKTDSINPLRCNWCPAESRPIFIRHAPASVMHALLEIADTEIGSITTRYDGRRRMAPTRSALIEISTTVYPHATFIANGSSLFCCFYRCLYLLVFNPTPLS